MKTPQPAIKSYFFDKGYRDLIAVISSSWVANLASANLYFGKASDAWKKEAFHYLIALFFGMAGLSILIFGTAVFLSASLLHILLLFSLFLIIYILFSIVWIIDRTYLLYKQIFSACPHCKHKIDHPTYLCPNCRREHSCLIPSEYGIMKRTCLCGHELPTNILNGRPALEAKCPQCSRELKTGERRPLCFPIVGASSVGKTCFLFSMTRALKEKIAPAHSLSFQFLEHKDQQLYERLDRNFSAGVSPEKTTELQASAFNFFLGSPTWKPEKLVYLYDAAGELYENSDQLHGNEHFGYLHGMIFLIDPISIRAYARLHQKDIDANRTLYRPSAIDVEDALDRILNFIQKRFGLRPDKPSPKPLAVVINKIDLLDLNSRLGVGAAKILQAKTPGLSLLEAQQILCRQFLVEFELSNFLSKLEVKFPNLRFFAVSALGSLPNGKSFQPINAVAPLLWLLAQADSRLKTLST